MSTDNALPTDVPSTPARKTPVARRQRLTMEQVSAILASAPDGSSLQVTWSWRDEPHSPPTTWTGTIVGPLQEQQCVLVDWPANLPGFVPSSGGITEWPSEDDINLAYIHKVVVRRPRALFGPRADNLTLHSHSEPTAVPRRPREAMSRREEFPAPFQSESAAIPKRAREEDEFSLFSSASNMHAHTAHDAHENLAGANLDDVALGERGIWRRLPNVEGLKVPVYMDQTSRFMYGPLLGPYAPGVWLQEASQWRLSKGVAFTTLEKDTEARALTETLVELVDNNKPRPNRECWASFCYLMRRLVSLWIMASPMGGRSAAESFVKSAEKQLRDGKLDYATALAEAAAQNTQTNAHEPDLESRIEKAVAKLLEKHLDHKQAEPRRDRGRGRGR